MTIVRLAELEIDPAQLKTRAVASIEKLGGLDIAVSNVSILAIGADEETWKRGFDIDLLCAARATLSCPGAPRRSRRGSRSRRGARPGSAAVVPDRAVGWSHLVGSQMRRLTLILGVIGVRLPPDCFAFGSQ